MSTFLILITVFYSYLSNNIQLFYLSLATITVVFFTISMLDLGDYKVTLVVIPLILAVSSEITGIIITINGPEVLNIGKINGSIIKAVIIAYTINIIVNVNHSQKENKGIIVFIIAITIFFATGSMFGIITGIISIIGIWGFITLYEKKNYRSAQLLLTTFLFIFITINFFIISINNFTIIKNKDNEIVDILQKGDYLFNIKSSYKVDGYYNIDIKEKKEVFTNLNNNNAKITIFATMNKDLVLLENNISPLKEMKIFHHIDRKIFDSVINNANGTLSKEEFKLAFEKSLPNLYFDVQIVYY
ncbi:hypothetical protein HOG21_00215 [bacterium]|nr:hypothetical protein [bacterium]